ncbi:MAG: patatin-like phospholipase family protein [Verrucomicrobiota bacterium]
MSENKLAIVCAGGGMSCVYCGGALEALAIEHDIRQPDFILAASGGAGSSLYYLTGQFEEMRRIWTHYLPSREFFSYRRFTKIMDVDYLIDEVVKKLEPLDIEKLRGLRTRYFIPVKNMRTGEGRYISCQDGLDVYEVLRATKALPIFYGRKVLIGDDHYVDSAFKLTKEDSVAKAIELGATHVVVIEINGHKESRLFAGGRKLLNHLSRKSAPAAHSGDTRIIRIRPDTNPASPITRATARLGKAYEKGYHDVKNSAELRDFLAPFKDPASA